MTGKEKSFKISLLTKILREEYGIEGRAQLMGAYSNMPPIDITIFVASVPISFPEKPDT